MRSWRLALTSALIVGALATVSVVAAVGPGINSAARCCEQAVRVSPPTTVPPPPLPSDPVAIIGDSLFAGIVWSSFLGSANTIQARLQATGRTVFANAVVGTSVPHGIIMVRNNSQVFRDAGVALIGFGTNEVLDTPGLDVATSRTAINRMVTELRNLNPTLRIVWVDVTVEGLFSRTQNWNQALAETARDINGFEVCGFREIALSHPEWFASDRTHLTSTGYAARRDVLIDCVVNGS